MKLYYETSFEDFAYNKCWSGAKDTIAELTSDEVERLGQYIEDMFEDEVDETELNDFLWFERDTIAEWLGYDDFDSIMNKNKEESEDSEDEV